MAKCFSAKTVLVKAIIAKGHVLVQNGYKIFTNDHVIKVHVSTIVFFCFVLSFLQKSYFKHTYTYE